MTTLTKPRLSRESWIDAGLEALMRTGPDALKAEPLARQLNTTKGSFYWHFKDVPEFHNALLAHWQSGAITALPDGNTVVQLRALATSLAQTHTAEPAIRAWAKGHRLAAQTLSQVDAQRLSQLDALLHDIGVANPEMSRILYAAALGMREVQNDDHATPEAIGTLVDLVLALR
ncbi:MAG: TetR/AcrR family transcriptional regulator [Roseovarius sp.]